MKTFNRLLLLFCLIMMGAQNAWASSQIWNHNHAKVDTVKIGKVLYECCHVYSTYYEPALPYGESDPIWNSHFYYASVVAIEGGTNEDVVIPETIASNGQNYPVKYFGFHTYEERIQKWDDGYITLWVRKRTPVAVTGTSIRNLTFKGKIEFKGDFQTTCTSVVFEKDVIISSDVIFISATNIQFYGSTEIAETGTLGCYNVSELRFFGITHAGMIDFNNSTRIRDIYFRSNIPNYYGMSDNYFKNVNLNQVTAHVANKTAAQCLAMHLTWAVYSDYGNVVPYVVDAVPFADDAVKDICVANWDTDRDGILSVQEAAAVTSLGDAFRGNTTIASFNELPYFTGLTSIDNNAFNGCTNLQSIILPEGVTAIGPGAFSGCSSLQSIIIPEGVTALRTNSFAGCSSLTTIDIPSSVNTIQGSVFYNCTNLESVKVHWAEPLTDVVANAFPNRAKQVLYVPTGTKAAYQAADVWKDFLWILEPGQSIDGPYAVFNQGVLKFYQDDDPFSHTGQAYFLNTLSHLPEWYGIRSEVISVSFDASFGNARPKSTCSWFDGMTNLSAIIGLENLNTSKVTNMSAMFRGCSKLVTLDLSHFGTSNVTSMESMFEGCTKLTTINVSGFSTATVENVSVSRMFYGCTALTNLNVTGFNTSNAGDVDMSEMFSGCSALTSLDLIDFDTSKATTLFGMFQGDYRLASLDLSNFNTANVTDMSNMFYGCTALTTVDLSSFNTARVTTMANMFLGCQQKLKILDLSSFNTAAVSNMSGMFNGCTNLIAIIVSDSWSTAHVSSSTNMFASCINLVGGNGTKYSGSYVDKTRARIDKPGTPGYLTGDGSILSPYVVLSSDGTTLTFYCDGQRLSHTETIYNLNSDYSQPEWYAIDGRLNEATQNVTTVVFDESFSYARPTTCYEWFYNRTALQTISGIENLNTSEVTNMQEMFYGCTGLTSLDLSHFNTSKVSRMSSMFQDCTNLTSLNVSGFTTVSNSSQVEASSMFSGCTSLTDLKMENFDTQYVTSMSFMFYNCSSLTFLNLSSFNTAKVQYMNSMFNGCSKLKTILVSEKWKTQAVLNSNFMFTGCSSIKGGKGTTYDSNHVDKLYARIDGGTTTPGYLTEDKVTYAQLSEDETILTFYCDNKKGARPGISYDLNTGNSNPGWYGKRASVTNVVFDASFAEVRPTSTYYWFYGMDKLVSIAGIEYLHTDNVTTMRSMFSGCNVLEGLDVSGFNTANVTHMGSMFSNCRLLTELDVAGFETGNVTNMSYMFNQCYALTSLNLSNFNTESVTSMEYMFYGCKGLTNLDVTNFITDNVTTMKDMFAGCNGLTSLDLSKFNTSKVTTMYEMFNNCYNLTSLDLSSFNTANVTTLYYTFNGCRSLKTLNLSNFETSNVKNFQYTFFGCSNLVTIYAGNWSRESMQYATYMFGNCTKIKGGKGTTYVDEFTTISYAHIDGGTDNPGYFTEKPDFLLGDVNSDGQISIADVTALVNIILGKDTEGVYNHAAADVNQDTTISIADVTALVNIILGKE